MQKINYSIGVGLAIIAYMLTKIFWPELEVVDMFYFFEIFCIILYSIIVSMAYKANKISNKKEHLYFMMSYIMLLMLGAVAIGMRFSILSFKNYTFHLIRIFEAFIYFFAIFLLYDKANYKKILALFSACILVNLAIVMVLMHSYWTEHLALLLYLELLLIYRYALKEKRQYFMSAFLLRVVAECTYVAYVLNGGGIFYILTAFIYISSIFEIAAYLNKEIDFEIMHLESGYSDRIEKLFYLNKRGILFISDMYIKDYNDSALALLEVENGNEVKNKSLLTIFDIMNEDALLYDLRQGESELSLPLKKNKGKVLKVKSSKVGGPEKDLYMLVLENELSFGNSLEVLNDSLSAFSYIYKRDDGYKYISRGFENIFGINKDKVLGDRGFLDKILKDGESQLLNCISKGEENFSFDEVYKINGKTKKIRETVSKIKMNDDEFFYGVGLDISDLYVKEKGLVSENEMLKNENIKTDMALSVVSHEIRTPITAIIGFVENIIINNDSLDEKIFGMIKKVYSNSIRLKELVDNLLDFNKLNAGKMEVFKEKVELKGLLEEVLTNNEMLIELKNIKLINLMDRVKDKVYILADSSMIYQIFNNILSNAIKYNRENGSITIVVDDDGERVVVSVEDTGIGLKDESKENVFKEYGRAKGSREKGTGLGLSLSKRLVEINGGKIWFDSEYEKGSTFYVRFEKE